MLHIRPFQSTESDYNAFIAIHNAYWEDDPRAVDMQKQIDKTHNPDVFYKRLMVELDDNIIATTEFGETHWIDISDQYYWHINILPAYEGRGYEAQIYDHIIAKINEQHPVRYFAGMRDDKVKQIAFIETRGYKLIQSEPTSQLDVTTFNPAPFNEIVQQVREMGIRIYSVTEIKEKDDDWITNLWNLQWAVRRDVPRDGETRREPFAQFKRRVTQDPSYQADANFIAVLNDNYIGMTGLSYNAVDPTLGQTHLTGVVREHRRKGIATALKVHAISIAKARGVKRIKTMNHETNPMLNLNLRLGFQSGPVWRYYVKKA